MDIDNADFAQSISCPAFGQRTVQFSGKALPAVAVYDREIAVLKFHTCLSEQIEPVDHEEEPSGDILFIVIIIDDADTERGQSCFAASLCMPDDTALAA